MTDSQVLQFVMKEHEAGTSQSQIITKLMQRGVDIQQIRRVKKTYERVAKDKGLGQISAGTEKEASNRMRKNNGETKAETTTSHKVKGKQVIDGTKPYSKTHPEFKQMEQELDTFLPDSVAFDGEEMPKVYLDQKEKKVFGRDIFNRKDLSFEPNMNIATPQNYRLGPGDAVIIDI